ncbi:MAG TPA: PAS domain-containing sensor histidine kinase, partial [Clostridia bacterium]
YENELKKYVDELKSTNEKLRESEEKFRQLFENMTNGFSLHEIITDENGEPFDFRYILVNKAYEQNMDQSMEKIVGRTIKEINPSVNETMIKTYCKVALTGEPISSEYYSKTLSKYFFVFCFSPKKGQFACIYEDITERKMAEINLVKAKEIAENANETKNEFLSLISHEFKTPIAVIDSAIQAMEFICKDELPDKAKEFLKKIRQNNNRQLKLVNNLLDITRANAGHLNVCKKNVDIVMLTKLIIESINIFAEQKGIKLTFYSALKTKVIGIDEEKYERILLNLLSNAVKFTPKGKLITVKVYQKAVKGKCKVCIQVKDTGIGIPDNKHEAIFERFEQVNSSLTRQAEGTGIGLHLVKMLVELMDGDITLESEVGCGSIFTVILPIAKEIKTPYKHMLKEINDDRLIQSVNIEFSDIYI